MRLDRYSRFDCKADISSLQVGYRKGFIDRETEKETGGKKEEKPY